LLRISLRISPPDRTGPSRTSRARTPSELAKHVPAGPTDSNRHHPGGRPTGGLPRASRIRRWAATFLPGGATASALSGTRESNAVCPGPRPGGSTVSLVPVVDRAQVRLRAHPSRPFMPSTVEFSTSKPADNWSGATQGRQDSNLQPSVLETDAQPVELHPSAVVSTKKTARSLVRAGGGRSRTFATCAT
jgi:hypothetical protein